MRKIEVKQEHYGWYVYVNGILIYAFGKANLSNDVLRYGGLENIADMYINAMQDEIQDIGNWPFVYIYLTPEELTELKEQLVAAWTQHFGVSEA